MLKLSKSAAKTTLILGLSIAVLGLHGCGIRGSLKTPPPLWGKGVSPQSQNSTTAVNNGAGAKGSTSNNATSDQNNDADNGTAAQPDEPSFDNQDNSRPDLDTNF